MIVSDLLGFSLGCDFESVARFWLANKRHGLTNVISAAVLWSMWKLRNEIYFQGTVWHRDGKTVTEDCKDVAALDSNIQAGAGLSSGKFCKSFGDPRKLTASDHVEDGGDEFIIRVGAVAAALHLDTNAHSAQHEAIS